MMAAVTVATVTMMTRIIIYEHWHEKDCLGKFTSIQYLIQPGYLQSLFPSHSINKRFAEKLHCHMFYCICIITVALIHLIL